MKSSFLLSLFFISIFVIPVVAQQAKPTLPWVDLYNGHPTTVMLDDNKTILCAWSCSHGGKASFIAESKNPSAS